MRFAVLDVGQMRMTTTEQVRGLAQRQAPPVAQHSEGFVGCGVIQHGGNSTAKTRDVKQNLSLRGGLLLNHCAATISAFLLGLFSEKETTLAVVRLYLSKQGGYSTEEGLR